MPMASAAVFTVVVSAVCRSVRRGVDFAICRRPSRLEAGMGDTPPSDCSYPTIDGESSCVAVYAPAERSVPTGLVTATPLALPFMVASAGLGGSSLGMSAAFWRRCVDVFDWPVILLEALGKSPERP